MRLTWLLLIDSTPSCSTSRSTFRVDTPFVYASITTPKSACSLRTSGGNVDVQLAENLALAVDARTSGGSIHSDFPGTLNKNKTQLTAQLNGGGTDLLLETSGGNIGIRKK